MIDKRISGALLPNAINVKFATVSFHTLTTTIWGSLPCRRTTNSFSFEVITSIAAMKRSLMIDTPMNRYSSREKYTKPRKIMSERLRFSCGLHTGTTRPGSQRVE